MEPRYPVYVLSKGRADRCYTARFLSRDKVPFFLVVEAFEEEVYRERFGDRVIVLPPESSGHGAVPVRNWIWGDAVARGAERHWQLDDNMLAVKRLWKGRRIPCAAGPALRAVEDFVDRYENVGIAGLAYEMFVVPMSKSVRRGKIQPFSLNVHVYSCMLLLNSLPFRWRGQWNADTDLCLQVLAGGLCTVLVNAFMVSKQATMIEPGGNTERYQGDGRLKMARSLERVWPHVVKIDRRFRRPQHVVDWRAFGTRLKRREDVDFDALAEVNEYGMELKQVSEVKSPDLRRLLKEHAEADE